MALRPADTAASEPPKKVHRVTKMELRYLLKGLREADNIMSIFVAFVKQKVDESEGVQLAHYPEWQVLWNKWSASDKLCFLLTFQLRGICNLLEKHTSGKERFARFLISWYSHVGSLACNSHEDAGVEACWSDLMHCRPWLARNTRCLLAAPRAVLQYGCTRLAHTARCEYY